MKTRRSAQLTPQDLARQNMAQTVKMVENSRMNKASAVLITEDELALEGLQQNDLITLQVENTDIVEQVLAFGTPLGNPEEAALVPLTIADFFIKAGAINVKLLDQQGGGLPFLELLNRRFQRHAVLLSSIEVITDSSALGEKQREEQITRIIVPENSASDSSTKSGAFIPQFTEYTASELLNKGIVCKVLAGSKVSFNMHVAAVDIPNFKIQK